MLNRDLLAPGFYLRRMRKQGIRRAVTSLVQTKIPYGLPLPRLPYVIVVEPTTFCNLRCVMCPSPTLASPRGTMSMSTYEQVLHQAVAGGAHRIRFVGLGEPLLHPRIAEMVAMAKRGGLYTEVSTNGTLLTPTLGQALLDAGLDEIGFSLDSADEAEYERIREGGTYREVLRNIEGFLELCRRRPDPPVTTARMVVMEGSDVNLFSRQWSGKVDSLQFNLMRTYAGTKAARGAASKPVSPPKPKHARRRVRCRQLMSHLIITWDGRVQLCNQSALIVGDLATASLTSIWHNHIFQSMRTVHKKYRGHTIKECRSCPIMEPAGLLGPEGPAAAEVTLRRSFDGEAIA